MTAADQTSPEVGFAASTEYFEQTVAWLEGQEAAGLTHGELEDRLTTDCRELFRRMTQDHLDVRAARETRLDAVVDADGIAHGAVEAGHTRPLTTVFGPVVVSRMAYRRKGRANLYPADAALNLPVEVHSHGLRRLAAIEATRGSYDSVVAAVGRATGQQVGKRQTEQLAARAATDFDSFYQHRPPPVLAKDDVVVLSADGKGIVMRPDGLRPATAKAARTATPKLATRLSKGEKANRKRMATVAAVYAITPAARSPDDIMSPPGHTPAKPPKAAGKWLTASVTHDVATVIAAMFDEAERRDPAHTATWVALVDGNNHQIDRINAEATRRGIKVRVIIDFVHVAEYLWGAAWCFFDEGDPAAEAWVAHQLRRILQGHARPVAHTIARKAATLQRTRRSKADDAVTYLRNKAPYLDYPHALAAGWPIATGVIEGAVRHLVKDRLDITGARWGLEGAEAVLKLRALAANDDLGDYFDYHQSQEQRRTHNIRYHDLALPCAA